jgi:hypothetical protein
MKERILVISALSVGNIFILFLTLACPALFAGTFYLLVRRLSSG